MEHIELAGIHSGDSACSIPPKSLPQKHIDTMTKYTEMIARELNVVGLTNVQYAICNDKVYILEANPRASRTVPLVSKVTGVSMARIATQVMIGKKLKELNIRKKKFSHVGVKEAVFPFNMFPEVDPVLGPEMRSTGEVLGMADSFGLAFFKAEDAAGQRLPTKGTVLITVAPADQPLILGAAKTLLELGFKIKATEGTKGFLEKRGISAEIIKKMHEGRPNILDALHNKEINLIINTPIGKNSKYDDSYIRKAAIKYKIPYITTPAAAIATAEGIKAYLKNKGTIKSLQEYLKEVKEV
jgi:carbamoyl-phosphate synthase large subunit